VRRGVAPPAAPAARRGAASARARERRDADANEVCTRVIGRASRARRSRMARASVGSRRWDPTPTAHIAARARDTPSARADGNGSWRPARTRDCTPRRAAVAAPVRARVDAMSVSNTSSRATFGADSACVDETQYRRNDDVRSASRLVSITKRYFTNTDAALAWTAALAFVSMLCGAPFAWGGLDASQRFFNTKEPATREYLSMSMWCMVMYFQEMLETLLVLVSGTPLVKARWVYRCSVVNYMRLGLFLFEGSQGNGYGRRNSVLVNTHRRSGMTIAIAFAWMYSHTIAAGIPRGRNFLKPRSIPHWVMLFHWLLLFVYGLTFAYTDAIQLYYFKVGTSAEYAVVNWLAHGVWQCIISGAVAMGSFPRELQAQYCAVHIVVEFLAMAVMVWQEHKLTLFADGIVQQQWANHLAMKLALLMTWGYGVYGGLAVGSKTRSRKSR